MCKNNLRYGFTLIEAIAVICIVGMLAAGSLLLLSRTLSRSQRHVSIANLRGLYERIRNESALKDQWLRFDFSEHRIDILDIESKVSAQSVAFDRHHQLAKLLINGRNIEHGVELIQFRDGLCASHAIQIRTPSGKYQWLMVSGAIDCVTELQHEESMDAQLAQWQAKWNNAH